MKRKQTIGEYLEFIATKCDVYYTEFFNALVSAWENGKSVCGSLVIDCRSKTEREVVFLVKNNDEVVGQFPVPTEFLSAQANSIPKFSEGKPIQSTKYDVSQSEQIDFRCIQDLRAGMTHVNLKAKVLEVSEAKRVTTRFGNIATLAKAVVADETGKIKLCLWNDQTKAVSVGDAVVISDARVARFGGEAQLSLGQKGTLTVEPAESHFVAADVPVQR